MKKTRRKLLAENYIGKRFGNWTVIASAGRDRVSRLHLLCVCDCGKEKSIAFSSLESKLSTSCGCFGRQRTTNSKKKPNGEAAFNQLFYKYRTNAKARGLEFNLTKQEFQDLTKLNCVYCDLVPSTIQETLGGKYVYNGVDRLDNSIGYTSNNSVPCCSKCNREKHRVSIEMIKKIYNLIVEKGL